MNKIDIKKIRPEFNESFGKPIPDQFVQKMEQSVIKFNRFTSTRANFQAYVDEDSVCSITVSRMINSLMNEKQFQRLLLEKKIDILL